MASLDVRDVLNLPQDGAAPRPTKRAKTTAPRTNLKGLAREVQSLGGDNPIAIIPEISIFKRRRSQATKKATSRWELRPFKNSARCDDSLILRHWRRKENGGGGGGDRAVTRENGDVPMEGADGDKQQEDGQPDKAEQPLEDSAFAKFNVHVDIPQYTDDQYHSNLRRHDWTKEETDYLLDLVRDFDLRWALIWDRYEYTPTRPRDPATNGDSAAVVPVSAPRSMEDLKARYYEVAAKMMAVQKPAQYMSQPEFSLYETMLKFDPHMETQRKKFAANALTRSKEEAREEESLLLEVKRILARQERFNEERRELYSRLDFPPSDHDISTFKSSQGLETLLKTLMTADKSKKRKSLMASDGANMAGPGSAGPNGQQAPAGSATPATAGSESRRDSIAASSAVAQRESVAVEKATPVEPPSKPNNKKGGAAPPERRRLTEQEEQVYGVTYHDRLGSGPTFRYEKVNKLFNHKSGQQQQRITNVLNELDVPSRLTMPTAAVTSQFEQLVHTVTQLVDLRKQLDKLDGELKIENARRAERDKAQGLAAKAAGKADKAAGLSEVAEDKDGGEKATPNGAAGDGNKANSDASPEKAAAAAAAAADGKTQEQSSAAAEPAAAAATNGDVAANAKKGDQEAADKAPEPTAPPPAKDDEMAAAADKDRSGRPSSRPGSRHKRSASVLSATSDKSKRQKR
ncbi:SWR1-complex protein 4 [Gaeumannomyces tritici R3-111a-1]|uniref:SWR1-complex protein 4 n=1 Tax=Gaeumannomyces tritici (strain R3-111a-1) TaxID=644352 RepID=J3P0B5_GAET3|nr:SWR1-complex protein 4 [Gaeumannomyces tritici R3-111a-1]EJT77048.1 SWR1-complex protein 4 [Gaeumannomyces tritici R3-111a-1]